MTKMGCLYAIVRFSPYVETEEFANVGIVLFVPSQRRLIFKLMTRKHARVTSFFEQLDGAVYRGVVSRLREELERASHVIKSQYASVEASKVFFQEIVRARETVIKFSAVRPLLIDNASVSLNELYGHYVERDFVTKEYRENVLERAMRRWLNTLGIGERFDRVEVGNDEYYATFPFVEVADSVSITAIKPLNLAQDQPSKILDHGGSWLFKLQTLRRKDLLPQKVLFPVEGPHEAGARGRAYNEIVQELRAAGATVFDFEDKSALTQQLSVV